MRHSVTTLGYRFRKALDDALYTLSRTLAAAPARPLPDARYYATWSYEAKRFDEPLPPAQMRRRMGSMAGASTSMGRARSESMHP